jgi:hypothetical protein
MISTVTTATVSTITTSVGIATSLGILAVLVLAAFLVTKELAGVEGHPRLQRFSRVLNVAIVPMLIAFSATVVARVAEFI